MNGFEGPFRFDIDTHGTDVPSPDLSEVVHSELEADGKYNPSNSKIYLFRIAVSEVETKIEKHHNWSEVLRIFIQAKVAVPQIQIVGVSPRNKRAKDVNQGDLGLDVMANAEAEGSLFDLFRFKLNISNFVKQNASENKYAVLNSFTKRSAQWVYSRAWPFLDFTKYLYVVVPNDLEAEKRFIKVSVKAVRKGNVELSQVALFEAPVVLPAMPIMKEA
jgi:hypothetical protein